MQFLHCAATVMCVMLITQRVRSSNTVLPEQDHSLSPARAGFFYTMNRSQKIITFVAIISIAFSALYILSYTKTTPLKLEVVPTISAFPLTYTIPVKIQASVYETMTAFASSSKSFNFKGKNYPELGFFIEEINGKKNQSGFYWTLYVNGVYSDKGASAHIVHPGDSIDWKYEKL